MQGLRTGETHSWALLLWIDDFLAGAEPGTGALRRLLLAPSVAPRAAGSNLAGGFGDDHCARAIPVDSGTNGGHVLRRIRIQNYKSLRDVDIELQPLSVLFGHNAAGKSNFVDALQLLTRIVSSRSLTKACEPSCPGHPLELLPIGPGGVEHPGGQAAASFRIEADIELSGHTVARVQDEIRGLGVTGDSAGAEGRSPAEASGRQYLRERLLRYAIEVEVIPRMRVLRLLDESLSALRQDGELKQSRNPFAERVGQKVHLRPETQSHPLQFRVGIDHAIISRPLYAPHYPHLLAAKYELQSWRLVDLDPRECRRPARAPREARHVGPAGQGLVAFLNTLQATDPAEFEAVEQRVREIAPRVRGLRLSTDRLGNVELSVVESDSGAVVPARLLSDGTLRVIGLMAATSAVGQPGLIGLEEPENGIHPHQIERVAAHLTDRARSGSAQLVITTHSPVLLDQIPPDHLYVVRRRAEGTRISRFTPWGNLAAAPQIRDYLRDPLEAEAGSDRGGDHPADDE